MGSGRSVADISYTHFVLMKVTDLKEQYGSIWASCSENGLNEMEWTEYYQKWIP